MDKSPVTTPYDTLVNLIKRVHSAKGRYHTQIAICDLFDAVGLSNVRPTKPVIDPLSDSHDALTFHPLVKAQPDPCPACRPNTRCRTPKCGRLAEDAQKKAAQAAADSMTLYKQGGTF